MGSIALWSPPPVQLVVLPPEKALPLLAVPAARPKFPGVPVLRYSTAGIMPLQASITVLTDISSQIARFCARVSRRQQHFTEPRHAFRSFRIVGMTALVENRQACQASTSRWHATAASRAVLCSLLISFARSGASCTLTRARAESCVVVGACTLVRLPGTSRSNRASAPRFPPIDSIRRSLVLFASSFELVLS